MLPKVENIIINNYLLGTNYSIVRVPKFNSLKITAKIVF